MSRNKTSIPEAPTFQVDPNIGWSQDRLKEQYGYLINGLTSEGGNLSGLLGDSISISPEVSRLSQQYAQSQLDPAYRQNRQNLINTLEANGQLTGSTTASALANLDSDYMASLTGMQAQYGLADVERALNNRVQLYTTGLSVGQNVGSTGLQNQNQMNQFALANYENQVAKAMYDNEQKRQQDAFWGTVGGTFLGPGGGLLIGGLTGGQTGATAGMGAGIGSLSAVLSGGMNMGGLQSAWGNQAGMTGSKYSPTSYTGSLGSESYTDVSRMPRMSNSLGGYYF